MSETAALRKQLDRRLSALRTERSGYLSHWQDLSDYVLPRRGKFNVTAGQSKGGKQGGKIIDPTGTLALRTLASGMMTGITSPARPWFRLSLPDRDLADWGGAREWLGEVTRRMEHIFAKSNVYNALHVLYEDLGLFGTAAMLIMEDHEDVVRAYPLTAGEYCLANSERLAVDTLYREFPMTVGQLVGRFGLDACSDNVRSMFRRGDLDTEIDVVHAVEPNDKRVVDAADAKGMPFRSVYFEKGSRTDAALSVKGFRSLPLVAPRWHLAGNEVYGRSPGMDALPDVRALQVMQKRAAQAIDKAVNPPLVAPPGMRNETVSVLPGAVNFASDPSGKDGFRPVYQVPPDIRGMREAINETQDRIRSAFFADLFMMMSQQDDVRTAYEIKIRQEEKMLMLGPVLERLQDELLDPLIDRTFDIMARTGLIPPPPDELQGQALQVDYISPLAQAQRSVATTGIERLVGFVGNLAAAVPAVLDKVDMDQAVDEYAEALGTPPKVIMSDDKVQGIRQARAQQEQAAQAMQMGMAAAQGAKTLSETETGAGQNALQRILGVAQ